ncbi:MAG: MFS transporter [Aquificaceae bacterium]|nr:MFS transporter [Aquificaceae bacterium]
MIALSADLTREEVRTRAFAQVGASIGLTFALSLVLAPLLAGAFGVPFLFFLTAFLSLLATYVLMTQVPEPVENSRDREIEPSLTNLALLLRSSDQLFLNFSVGFLHACMVVLFTVVPYELVYSYHMPKLTHWKIYLPAILLALAVMVPAILLAEKKGKLREVFLSGVFLVGLSFLSFELVRSFWGLVFMVFLFFLGFNLLEALIPSLLTKLTHRDLRGLSLGLFNTVQFLGAFAGGLWGGLALKQGSHLMTLTATALCFFWLLVSLLWFKRLKVRA